MEEAARARVRCAWAIFKELSPILTARGASYHINGKIYKVCVQSAQSGEDGTDDGEMDVWSVAEG